MALPGLFSYLFVSYMMFVLSSFVPHAFPFLVHREGCVLLLWRSLGFFIHVSEQK